MDSPKEHPVWYLNFRKGSEPIPLRVRKLLDEDLKTVDIYHQAGNALVIDTRLDATLDQLEEDKHRLEQITGTTLLETQLPIEDEYYLQGTTVPLSLVALAINTELQQQSFFTRLRSEEHRFNAAVDAAKNRMRKPD